MIQKMFPTINVMSIFRRSTVAEVSKVFIKRHLKILNRSIKSSFTTENYGILLKKSKTYV